MNDYKKKLTQTESGIWVFKGFGNELYYNYVLHFEDNKVVFSCNTCKSEYGIPWTSNIVRIGTFEIDSDILTLNFISAKYFDKDSLSESLNVKMKIKIEEIKVTVKEHLGKLFYIENPNYTPKDIEITEYKLIMKRISGKNIFENRNENEEIELIAERPIID